MDSGTLPTKDVNWISKPEPGWVILPMAESLRRNNFVSGDLSGERLTVSYFRNEADGSLRAKVLFGPGTQGPPGHAHGGSMAAVLDESMGAAAWLAGNMVVAVELNTRFKGMLPLGTRCIVEGRVDSVSGRKVLVSGVLRGVDGEVYSEGEAVFIKLSEDQIAQLSVVGADGAGAENFFATARAKQDPGDLLTSGS